MTDAGKMGTRQEAAADIAFRLRKTSQRALDELAANLIEAMSADLVKATIKVERLTAELEVARAENAWRPIESYTGEWPERVDVWLHIYASPRSMGWADSFRVTDAYKRDRKWFHNHGGKEMELYRDYVGHWRPLSPPPTEPTK